MLSSSVMLGSQRLTPPPAHSADQKTSSGYRDQFEQHVLHGGLGDDLASMSGMPVGIMPIVVTMPVIVIVSVIAVGTVLMFVVMSVVVSVIMVVIAVGTVLMIAHLNNCSCDF